MAFYVQWHSRKYSLSELLDLDTNQIPEENWKELIKLAHVWNSEATAIKVQTSGSTGKPKVILLKKKYMEASAKATGDYFGFKTDWKLCNPLPFKYIAGKMMFVRAVVWDIPLLVIEPSSNPLKALDEPVDFMVMTPHQLQIALDNSNEKLKNATNILLGGAAVSLQLEKKIQDISASCYIGYGMTETTSHVAVRPLNKTKAASFYSAVSSINFSTDQRGCLNIHAPQLGHDTLTTNDKVKLLDSTTFQWLGRIDHVINSGGIKIHPEQVEKKLASFIAVPFYVIGKKHELYGEVPVIYLEGIIHEELLEPWQKLARESLGTYQFPHDWKLVKSFRYTETGKIKRIHL